MPTKWVQEKASQFILIEALNELLIQALNNLLIITFCFLVFLRKRKPRKNTTKQWFPKNMADSAQQHDDNPQDDPGRTEGTSETPRRHKKRAVGKKLTPKKKNV